MKALSIKEPWGSFIISGRKTIETRKWSTKYRGDILLVTSLKPDFEGYLKYSNEIQHLYGGGLTIAFVELWHIQPMTQLSEKAAMCRVFNKAQAWYLRNIRPIEQPDRFQVRGKLGLYDVEVPKELLEKYGVKL